MQPLTRKHPLSKVLTIAIPPAYAFLAEIKDLATLFDRARDLPFITNTKQDIAGRYGGQVLAQYSIVPRTAAVSDSAETCLELCRRGLGLYICPDLSPRRLRSLGEGLILRPLGVTYPIDLAWRKGLYVPAALRVFKEACQEETAGLNS